jgi:beta-lactamase class A
MKDKIFLLLVTIIVSVTAGILLGVFCFDNDNKIVNNSISIESKQIRSKGYEFINPLIDCDNYKPSDKRSLSLIKSKINTFLESQDKSKLITSSVYLRILNDGPWMGINENAFYTPASLLKVPMMVACYKKAETEPQFLKRKVKYEKFNSSFVQTVMDSNELVVGSNYPVEKLIEKMIVFSDNASLELIANEIGDEFFFSVMRDFDCDIKSRKTSEDYITVREYSSFLRILYNGTYLTPEYSDLCLRIMSQSHYPLGIPRYLPENTKVAHKFGEVGTTESFQKQLHDCGIVYADNNPYLLCLMTKGYDFDYLCSVLADVSKIVYENF